MACTNKSAFHKRGLVNIRFAPKVTEVLRLRSSGGISGGIEPYSSALLVNHAHMSLTNRLGVIFSEHG
jgi:hypothetical protein